MQREGPRSRTTMIAVSSVVLVVIAFLVIAVVLAKTTPKTNLGTGLATTSTTRVQPSRSTTSTSTTTAPLASAKGKPCVPVGDPLPHGSPPVPVEVGPPPGELVIHDLQSGTGPAVTENDSVSVKYTEVACSTGSLIGSSYKKGSTVPPQAVSKLFPGLRQGILGMQVGGRRVIGIPPALAFGEKGQPPKIAPDETLWFVIDLVDAKPV